MPTFGEFETVGEPLAVSEERSHVTTVWMARKGGAGDSRFYAVKCYAPRPDESKEQRPGQALEKDPVLAFLAGIRDLDQARKAGGRFLAPVYASGVFPGGAWYATDYCERKTLKEYIVREGLVDDASLRHVVHSVVAGCLALQRSRAAGYSHGNIKPGNVLLMGRPQPLRKTPFELADPHPAPLQLAGMEGGDLGTPAEISVVAELKDLRAIGELVLELVEGRLARSGYEFNYPVLPSDKWTALGGPGEFWLDFCNRLLDPNLSLKTASLANFEREFQPRPGLEKWVQSLSGLGAFYGRVAGRVREFCASVWASLARRQPVREGDEKKEVKESASAWDVKARGEPILARATRWFGVIGAGLRDVLAKVGPVLGGTLAQLRAATSAAGQKLRMVVAQPGFKSGLGGVLKVALALGLVCLLGMGLFFGGRAIFHRARSSGRSKAVVENEAPVSKPETSRPETITTNTPPPGEAPVTAATESGKALTTTNLAGRRPPTIVEINTNAGHLPAKVVESPPKPAAYQTNHAVAATNRENLPVATNSNLVAAGHPPPPSAPVVKPAEPVMSNAVLAPRPDPEIARQQEQFKFLTNQAWKAFGTKDYSNTVVWLRAGLKVLPQDQGATNLLAECFRHATNVAWNAYIKEDFWNAAEGFRVAAWIRTNDPGSAEMLASCFRQVTNRAWKAYASEDFSNAAESFRLAARIQPDDQSSGGQEASAHAHMYVADLERKLAAAITNAGTAFATNNYDGARVKLDEAAPLSHTVSNALAGTGDWTLNERERFGRCQQAASDLRGQLEAQKVKEEASKNSVAPKPVSAPPSVAVEPKPADVVTMKEPTNPAPVAADDNYDQKIRLAQAALERGDLTNAEAYAREAKALQADNQTAKDLEEQAHLEALRKFWLDQRDGKAARMYTDGQIAKSLKAIEKSLKNAPFETALKEAKDQIRRNQQDALMQVNRALAIKPWDDEAKELKARITGTPAK